MAGITISTGAFNTRIDNVRFVNGADLVDNSTGPSHVRNCWFDGTPRPGNRMLFSGNVAFNAVAISTGTVGAILVGNYIRTAGTAVQDEGTGTVYVANRVSVTDSALPYDLSAATNYVLHDPHVFRWTSTAASTGTHPIVFYPPFKGQIVDARLMLGSTSTGTTTVDVNQGGASIYASSTAQPSVAAGSRDSGWLFGDSTSAYNVSTTDAVTLTVDAAGTAVPYVVEARMLPVSTA